VADRLEHPASEALGSAFGQPPDDCQLLPAPCLCLMASRGGVPRWVRKAGGRWAVGMGSPSALKAGQPAISLALVSEFRDLCSFDSPSSPICSPRPAPEWSPSSLSTVHQSRPVPKVRLSSRLPSQPHHACARVLVACCCCSTYLNNSSRQHCTSPAAAPPIAACPRSASRSLPTAL
jgi:hypothetical protein